MIKRLLVATVLCFTVAGTTLAVDGGAEIDERIINVRDELDRAYSLWDLEAMMAARAGFERLLDRGGRDWLIRYYIALSDYRLIVYYLSGREHEKMDPYIKEAKEHLEQSIEEKPDFSESYALLAAILGMQITRNPFSGLWLGPRIGGIIAEAKKLEHDNPRIWFIEGIGAYHRPELFGGGYDNARKALLKSIEYFSTDAIDDRTLPSWGESEAYAWLGYFEMQNNALDDARVYLERALDVDPDNGWVTYHLMPRLNKMAERQ
jgi:tetratricopeptide (TPR) repeat protein